MNPSVTNKKFNERGWFIYRKSTKPGNCFAVCFIKACELFKDSKVLGHSEPELLIFGKKILTSNPKTEFSPALKYLVDNCYSAILMDPNPGTDWGTSLNKVNFSKKRYKKSNILALSKRGYCVIPSVLNSSGRADHAVLIYGDRIFDPVNETEWKKNLKIESFDRYFPGYEKKRFLLAFKKGSN